MSDTHEHDDSPAMLAFSIDRETCLVAILNSAKCECGRMHVTRVQLDRIESDAVGEMLMAVLMAVQFSERSVDVTDLVEFVDDVDRTVRDL